MEIVEFRGITYGKYQSQIYVFEPTWDSFRPITRVGWDGTKIAIDDSQYKTNLFSPFYGYSSLGQKAECRRFIQTTELENARIIQDPLEFWKWCGESEAKWWLDRPCVFLNPCVSRDHQDWKRYLKYLNTRAKTLRHPPSGRITKRLVPR